MALKLLLFGNKSLMESVTAKLRGGHNLSDDEQVKVQTINIHEKDYLLFSIPDRTLISSQSTGTNGLLFFLDAAVPLFEQKQFLFQLLRQKRQFDSVPIAIAFEKDKEITIKDVINYFQLFKVKDRPSMIKEITLGQVETITDIFKWIDSQNQFRNTKTFNAQPKIVKIKPKYRESDPEAVQSKYDTLMKDKNFKALPVKQQEQNYVTKEKQRIKDQNMKAQLANFNKNKKKMAPYDIKPTPNPKIQANLNFFLKDPKNDKEAEVNIKIQTDDFKERPKEKPYVPKKTGINISTQIEENQLFDFDKQVRPILDILVTKSLQFASLELEEQEQFSKMQKYKSIYNDKVKKQKNQEEKHIQHEKDLIKDKNRLLQKYRLKDQAKTNVTRKLINYEVSHEFLKGIYSQASSNLYQRNYFNDSLEEYLKTDYMNQLMALTVKSYQHLVEKQSAVKGLFEKDCIEPIIEKTITKKKQQEELKEQKIKRKINSSQNQRCVHLFYEQPTVLSFSSFAKFLNKYFEGNLQQFVKNKQDQIQQFQDKIQTNEANEEDLNKFKNLQNQQFSKQHTAFLINSDDEISFQVTPNQYEKSLYNPINLGILVFNKTNEPVHNSFITQNNSQLPYLRYINGLRQRRSLVNMDQGICLDLAKVPQSIKTIVLIIRINNIAQFNGQNINKIKHAAYNLQMYERSIGMHKVNIGEKIKWQEVLKVGEGEEQAGEKSKQNLHIVCYSLTRKFEMNLWYLEDIRYVCRANKGQNQEIVDELVKFYRQSCHLLKHEEEEEAQRAVSSKKLSSREKKRTKSKKNIEEQEAAKKKAMINQVISKALSSVKIDLRMPFQTIYDQLGNSVKQWKEFIEFCGEIGWQIVTKDGKKLSNMDQIRKFKKIGDLKVQKIIPKIQPIEEKHEEQGEEENHLPEQE